MGDEWLKTERYQALVKAVRASEFAAQAAIIEQAIAECTGSEKAFWIMARSSFRQRFPAPVQDLIQADLFLALETAPDDPEIRRMVLATALRSAVIAENLDGFRAMARTTPREVLDLRRSSNFGSVMAAIHEAHRRWQAAYRARTRSIRTMEAQSSEHRAAMKGWLACEYAYRAVDAVACGRIDDAAGDVEQAYALRGPTLSAHFQHLIPAHAAAEVAFARGRPDEARAALQRGLAENARAGTMRTEAYLQIRIDLLAARMARAEGNETGFRHFGERALNAALAANRQWMAARVRAVLDGAPF